MEKEKCWSCTRMKGDVKLRPGDDRLCGTCYDKNEEALSKLRAGDNTGVLGCPAADGTSDCYSCRKAITGVTGVLKWHLLLFSMGGWPRAGTPSSRATCRGLIYFGLWAGASRRVFPGTGILRYWPEYCDPLGQRGRKSSSGDSRSVQLNCCA